MKRKSFEAGMEIFKVGAPSDFAYLIVTGEVEIQLPSGRKINFTPGEVFGEMGLIDQRPRSATAIAVKKTTCAAYTEAELFQSIRDAPDDAIALIRALIDRLRSSNQFSHENVSTFLGRD